MLPIQTKKILCILQLPPPVHGVSLMNNYLLNSILIKANFDFQVVNLQFASSMKELKKFTFLKIFKAVYYAFLICYKVVRFKPDLVYFTLSPSGYAFYRDTIYVLILKLFGLKILFHLHGKGINKASENNFIKKYVYRTVFKNTNVICLTKKLTKDIEHVYSSVPYIVPNGIPIHPKSSQKRYKTDEVVQILYLSNYDESKGILKLIDALKLLKERGFTFNARLVGAPTNLSIKKVENYIQKRNLESYIQVVGPKYGEEKYNELQAADIFVFPTYYSNEAFPLVNLEAMQFGLPVISTFEGSIPDIVINNETGFLIEIQNAQMLAEKIAILLKDKDLRIEMGKKGYERFMNNYTLNHFENSMNKTFWEILGIH